MIPVDRVHLGAMLIYAVRYALGRRTYVVGETCDLVRAYATHVSHGVLSRVRHDVEHELRRVEATGHTLGDPYDHAEWIRLAEWLRERDARAPALATEASDARGERCAACGHEQRMHEERP